MNIAIASLIGACLMPLACAVIAKWGFSGYDNRQPREWLARQTGFRARANAAQANSWEALAVFGPAVVLAIAREAPAHLVDGLAAAFLLLRIAYVALYVANLSTLRSLVWLAGYAASLSLLALALG